jgi:hypothetical protein
MGIRSTPSGQTESRLNRKGGLGVGGWGLGVPCEMGSMCGVNDLLSIRKREGVSYTLCTYTIGLWLVRVTSKGKYLGLLYIRSSLRAFG